MGGVCGCYFISSERISLSDEVTAKQRPEGVHGAIIFYLGEEHSGEYSCDLS